MKKFLLACMVVSSSLSPALMAQSAQEQGQVEEKKNINGLGFVVSSSGGARLKENKLYYKSGKGYKSVNIAGRTVSDRVPIAGGSVALWDSDPTPQTKDAEVPKATLTVNVPSGSGNRPICILQLSKADGSSALKMNPIVIGSNVIPSQGQHIINLSGYPLTMYTATKSDFSDRKEAKIAPNRSNGTKVASDNIWSLRGTDGEVLSFMLMATLERGKDPVRVRASRFSVSNKQAQVTLILKDPARAGVKMESITVPAPAPRGGR